MTAGLRLPPRRTNTARLARRLRPAGAPRPGRGVVESVSGNKAVVLVLGAARSATVPAHLTVAAGDVVALEYTPGKWTVTGIPVRGEV